MWLGLAGCAAQPSPVPAAPPPVERAFVPHTPTPGTSDDTATDSIALAMGGGEEQARRVVLELIEAILERDLHALEALFAPRVAILREGRSVGRAKAAQRCLRAGQRASWQTETRAEDAIDLASLQTPRADAAHAPGPLPPGILPSDRVASPRLLPAFQSANDRRAYACLEGIYIRPGHQPSIIGLAR